MDDTSANATAVDADAVEPQEHGNRLARNALGLAGNIGIALGPPAVTFLVPRFGLPGTLGLLMPGLLVAALLATVLPTLMAAPALSV